MIETAHPRCVIYTSRVARPLRTVDLARLYDESAVRNRAAGITGLLLYDGFRFLQALEGRTAAVRATLQRIESDPRHRGIEYVSDQLLPIRQFARWSVDEGGAGTDGGAFVAAVKGSVATVRDPAVKAAFIGFAALAARRRHYSC